MKAKSINQKYIEIKEGKRKEIVLQKYTIIYNLVFTWKDYIGYIELDLNNEIDTLNFFSKFIQEVKLRNDTVLSDRKDILGFLYRIENTSRLEFLYITRQFGLEARKMLESKREIELEMEVEIARGSTSIPLFVDLWRKRELAETYGWTFDQIDSMNFTDIELLKKLNQK